MVADKTDGDEDDYGGFVTPSTPLWCLLILEDHVTATVCSFPKTFGLVESPRKSYNDREDTTSLTYKTWRMIPQHRDSRVL